MWITIWVTTWKGTAVEWARSAKTVQGARRILNECQRNRDFAERNSEPAWLRVVCAQRVQVAQERLAELEREK